MTATQSDANASLLLVGADAPLCEAIQNAAPDARLQTAEDVFDALAQATESAADVVLVPTGLLGRRRGQIFHAFRHAAPAAKLALLCAPSSEPDARQACREGADDYLLTPIERRELLDVLDRSGAAITDDEAAATPAPAPRAAARRSAAAADADLATLKTIGELLGADGADGAEPQVLLQKVVDVVAAQLGARDAAAVLLNAAGEPEQWAGTAALAADAASKPVRHEIELAHALLDGDRLLGWLNLGPPRSGGHYNRRQIDRVARWGGLLAQLIAAARRRATLRWLAITDDLSGLHNRRYFDHFLRRIVRRAGDERFRVTVMIFDIDDFKHYNDQYSHMVGDAIIRDVAMLMRRCTRPHDVVARFGGDEFAVIFWDNEQPRQPNSEHPHDALAMAERFRDEMGRHRFEAIGPKAQGRLTCSGGLASFPWDAKDADSLLAKADEALLAAKRSGKDRILLVGKDSA